LPICEGRKRDEEDVTSVLHRKKRWTWLPERKRLRLGSQEAIVLTPNKNRGSQRRPIGVVGRKRSASTYGKSQPKPEPGVKNGRRHVDVNMPWREGVIWERYLPSL